MAIFLAIAIVRILVMWEQMVLFYCPEFVAEKVLCRKTWCESYHLGNNMALRCLAFIASYMT